MNSLISTIIIYLLNPFRGAAKLAGFLIEKDLKSVGCSIATQALFFTDSFLPRIGIAYFYNCKNRIVNNALWLLVTLTRIFLQILFICCMPGIVTAPFATSVIGIISLFAINCE